KPIASEDISVSEDILMNIDKFLHSHGIKRADVDIGLRLPKEQIFFRQMLLPVEASGALNLVVTQDLVKKTPFKVEDIYDDYAVSEQEGGKIKVWQWIVRRKYVLEALHPLPIDIGKLTFITCDYQETEEPAPFINLCSNVTSKGTR